MAAPTRPAPTGGATRISLHAYTDLPDVGPPRFMRQFTHSGDGVADVATRAALARLPLFRPSAGSLHFTKTACEDIGDYYWPDDDPGPSDKELKAVMKFVEDNFESLAVGDMIQVTLEPEGTIIYWQYEGAMSVPPYCQNLHRFKRLATKPPKLILEDARRRGRIHKITASGVADVPYEILDENGDEPAVPAPELRDPTDLPEPERPQPAPRPGEGLTGIPRLPRPSLGKSKPVPEEDEDKYAPPPETAPCNEKVYAKKDFTAKIVLAVVTTREKPFRQPWMPSGAELNDLFKTERDALEEQAKNYDRGLATLEGLETQADGLASCKDPKCPQVEGLSIEGWDLEDIWSPGLGGTTYSDPRPVGDPDNPRGYFVSAPF
jgi:hypothetical protein